ncbi:MAG: ABC transporter ATP-binding protein [Deltaproteobacteria bacterium]|nr:ABC transporter ATP-binding protein [Deltaproteobacteria bacterium]
MLKVQSLNVSYGDLQILWDVSFEVKEGEIVVLLGGNGAGKSTSLKTISSLVKPMSGTVEFLGVKLNEVPSHKVIDYGLAHVPEGRRLFPDMSVEENLILGSLTSKARAKRKETLEWLYEMFPRLKERQKQPAGTLSGGEQQMAAIARGLMSLPKLVMFDEPSLGLAPIMVSEIFKIVEKVNQQGATVLLVEQNVHHTLAMCDRAYVLENGRIVLSGTGEEFLNNDHIKEAYLGI